MEVLGGEVVSYERGTPVRTPLLSLNKWTMRRGSEAGSYLRLIDFVYHATLGLRVIKKKKKERPGHMSEVSL